MTNNCHIELILDLFCNPCVVRILIKKPGFGSNPLAEKVLTKDTKWVLYGHKKYRALKPQIDKQYYTKFREKYSEY